MSAALVKQALEVVDPDFKTKGSKNKKKSDVLALLPQHHKTIGKSYKKGKKEKVGLAFKKKQTVQEAKKELKTKGQILKENLRKLELIKRNSIIILDKKHTQNIIERGRTKRPIERTEEKRKKSKTVFTDEDFEKFEKEYFS
ncbi:uncharacterized protein LOC143205862 [Rhynchophorus ferrugineus]|uniref:Active regulator of SIRT1 n=1 Tax=Rhynchophorus ferrugineus TaxID=354439 RepID=A0A834IGV6_RHYFE|nr:hypothetical protein GWI33_013520 [Rhynchophorus ferrugineus]